MPLPSDSGCVGQVELGCSCFSAKKTVLALRLLIMMSQSLELILTISTTTYTGLGIIYEYHGSEINTMLGNNCK